MMTDIIKEYLNIMWEESDFPCYKYNNKDCPEIIENYIDWLEKIVLACSDCPYGYDLATLREDFERENL